ncbi:hypothetical protein, partial [Leptospira interrogans]|uniref:hypothetical protein n=1 Tax=Leptospira interrogans TaxID=173 RepID=UPI001D1458D6
FASEAHDAQQLGLKEAIKSELEYERDNHEPEAVSESCVGRCNPSATKCTSWAYANQIIDVLKSMQMLHDSTVCEECSCCSQTRNHLAAR